MNDSSKKFTKFVKKQIERNNHTKMQDKLFPKKTFELKKIMPIYRNPTNCLGYIHITNPNLSKVPIGSSYDTIDSSYSNYNNFNKIRPPLEDPLKLETQRRYLSYSQDKYYLNSRNIFAKSNIHSPKELFPNSNVYYNEYDFGNNNNFINNDYFYYNNSNNNENIRNKKFIHYSINLDNISNIKINNNYDNTNNNSTYLDNINSVKKESNYNNYIINANINYNYINNGTNFNTINEYNNRYNTIFNSIDATNYNNLKIHINEEPYIFYSKTDLYDSNYDENRKMQYFSQTNIKENNNSYYYSEPNNKFINKSKTFLKEGFKPNQSISNKNYKYSKSQKKNISFNELNIENKDFLNKRKESFSSKKINKQTRERKNKIKIESNSQKSNNFKQVFSHRIRANNNLEDFSNHNNNNFHVIKNTKKNDYTLIKKENNKYLINNIGFFSRNNIKKKEIFHFKRIKAKAPFIPINKKNSKSMIDSTKHPNLPERNRNKMNDNKKEKSLNIIDKFKMLNSNRIITRKSLKVKTNTNNYSSRQNSKINMLINKNPINKKILTSRKHKKIFLSNLIKKECGICHKMIDSHLFKIHSNLHPTQILDWLFLGTFSNACDIEELRRNKINYVLNCAVECNNTKLPMDIEEYHLDVKDSENFDIIEYFDEANDFINKCRLDGGKILVHCKFGISRSPTFIIAYLSRYNKLTVDEALRFVCQKRSQIKPNNGFMKQLYLYEEFY